MKAVGWRGRGKLEVEGLERENRGQILEAAASVRPISARACLSAADNRSAFEKRGRGVGMKTIAFPRRGEQRVRGKSVTGDGRWW